MVVREDGNEVLIATIIVNHKRVYKTRTTKMKSNNPFVSVISLDTLMIRMQELRRITRTQIHRNSES